MSRLSPTLLAAALLATSQPLAATDALSSSYWDAAYASTEVDDGTQAEDVEGFRLGAGVGLFGMVSLIADYDQHRYDSDVREGFGSAGLAFHNDNPVWRVHGALTYERLVIGSGPDEEGYGVEVGARYMFPNVEVRAAYRYLDFGTVDKTETDFTGARYGAGLAVQLSPWWSLVADYQVREHKEKDGGTTTTVDYNTYSVGLRRYFATDTDRKARFGGILHGLFGGDGEEAPAE